MPRNKRQLVSQKDGSIHIISRTVGGDIWFNEQEKEYFLKLIERFAAGFYVKIHSFCVMSTHFHIMATSLDCDAKKAGEKELYRRYRLMYGKQAEPPVGSQQSDGSIIPDGDGGVARLRERLGSISRFVQELKQTFSCWYNTNHERKGYLWGDRFKGIILDKGEMQLTCSAYIDLNPIRAKIVECPEDYRWSSLGMRVRKPNRSKVFLVAMFDPIGEGFGTSKRLWGKNDANLFFWYREFVYISGGIKREGKGTIPQKLIDDVKRCHGKLGIGDSLRYRARNISEGIAIGGFEFIAGIQELLNRKTIRPRSFLQGKQLFTTRVLRS